MGLFSNNPPRNGRFNTENVAQPVEVEPSCEAVRSDMLWAAELYLQRTVDSSYPRPDELGTLPQEIIDQIEEQNNEFVVKDEYPLNIHQIRNKVAAAVEAPSERLAAPQNDKVVFEDFQNTTTAYMTDNGGKSKAA